MAETSRPVFIGDPNSERFLRLKTILYKAFEVEAQQAKNFAELQVLIEESNKSREQAENIGEARATWKNASPLIFITDDLPRAPTKISSLDQVKIDFSNVEKWNKRDDFVTVLIVTRETEIDWRGVIPPTYTIHLSNPPTKEEQTKEERSIVKVLDGHGGLKTVFAGFKTVWDKDNHTLREQIRSLSDERNLEDGENYLKELIGRCIDCSKVEKVEIKQLGQGKSGASVFRLRVETRQDATEEVKKQEFVLKLCQAGAVWKLASEVSGQMKASQGLGHPGYKEHIPKMKLAHRSCDELEGLKKIKQPNLYIVQYSHWYAVHYDFLGGHAFGEFTDLETALTASAIDLEKKFAGTDFAVAATDANEAQAVRVRFLELILQWLCEHWYANSATGQVHRKEMIVWDTDNASDQKYDDLPPYRLTGKSKGWIQSFLDSPEAEMGARFYSEWENRVNKIMRLVSQDDLTKNQLGQLSKPLPMILSHVHGDLNASNILLWLKYKHPFLIDFPFYQDAGHALQDFARLEVEIKFALLDRQKDSPKEHLKAFEHTYSQMPIWQEMEDRLLDQWDQKASGWSAEGYKENVQLCYALVQLVRHKAQEVQQNTQCPGPPAGDFLSEYRPALLYHTLRAIGYPSLSVFKRLLAVYSASLILEKLNCFTDLDAI
jgi:hypothetical protein